ncbi:MAG: hypothetical protein R2755_27320 [Acidimicrobiales bacterium]
MAALEARDGVRVHRYDDLEAMRRAIRRFGIAGGVAVPADADATLAGTGTVALTIVVPRTGESAVSVQRVLDGAAATAGVPLGARRLRRGAHRCRPRCGPSHRRRPRRRGAGATIEIEERTVVPPAVPPTTASPRALQNLVLFTFITALTSATLLVRARRTGVLRRPGPPHRAGHPTDRYGGRLVRAVPAAIGAAGGRRGGGFGVDWVAGGGGAAGGHLRRGGRRRRAVGGRSAATRTGSGR